MKGQLAAVLSGLLGVATAADEPQYYPSVTPRVLSFPADYGSHPQFRTEWWYVTGWLQTDAGEWLGFQVTFFRTRPKIDARNPSSFRPAEILIAHCAVSDPKRGRLWQDQRIRRAAPRLAEAASDDTRLMIERWTLQRAAGVYHANVTGEEFSLQLAMTPTQPPVLNGEQGVSRKGPAAAAASYYYSIPHLRVAGAVTRAGVSEHVHGDAWFDHEWSSDYLDADAAGWDWTGINLDDGGAVMAFRIRDARGATHWAGGTLRSATGETTVFAPSDVRFEPQRSWTSTRTGIRYPVVWNIQVGTRRLRLEPLLDDQENDTRLTTGAIYWEGAVRALDEGRSIGKGYLELTGYGERLQLR